MKVRLICNSVSGLGPGRTVQLSAQGEGGKPFVQGVSGTLTLAGEAGEGINHGDILEAEFKPVSQEVLSAEAKREAAKGN